MILLLLRILTLLTLLSLVAALLRLVVVRGRALPQPVRAAWTLVLTRLAIITVNTGLVELVWLLRTLDRGAALVALGRRLYNPAYFLNGAVDAVLPFAVLALFLWPVAPRRLFVLLGVVLAGLIAFALGVPAIQEWSVLMTYSQALSLVGLAGYLGFCALYLLGRVAPADAYLAGYLAIQGCFEMLLPIQAAFFQMAGREGAVQLWTLNQLLQLTTAAAGLVVVLALLGTRPRADHLSPVLRTAR